MDEKMIELIAIGASVAGHCQPCLSYHVDKARDLGIEDAQIEEAINVGKMIEKGAMSAVNAFARDLMTQENSDERLCCSNGGCCS